MIVNQIILKEYPDRYTEILISVGLVVTETIK